MTAKPDNTHLHILLYGSVQGVGFREFTRRHARRLGLAGHVLNRSDGTVEVHAAGSPAALEELRQSLAHGPPHATVTRIETLSPGSSPREAPLEAPFEIRRTR